MKQKTSPINAIFFWMIAVSIVVAGFTGTVSTVSDVIFSASKSAVILCLGLIGPMALWLGVMKVAEAGGLTKIIARGLRPVMTFLFPDLPTDHPATAAIIMNMAANMLGLGNAATPLGIKAMQELDKLNPEKGTATDAMALFLAINTSSIAILPLGVITVRAAAGATTPASILLPAILATMVSTAVAIFMAKFLSKRSPLASVLTEEEAQRIAPKEDEDAPKGSMSKWLWVLLIALGVSLMYAGLNATLANSRTSLLMDGSLFFPMWKAMVPALTAWMVPLLLLGILFFGTARKVPIYEVLTEGAKDGFETAKRIIPFMVAIFVAIGLIRASGTLDILNHFLSPILSLIGMPTEAVPMALIRPLSGSGAFGIMSEIVSTQPNTFLADLVSVMQGSTETTFYVMAVYFGAIGVKRMRHALPAALMADAAGIAAALFFTKLFLT